MTTSFDSVAMLSEQELLAHFEALVVRDRRTTAGLLVAIAEIDERKLWAAHACSSMFGFCMEHFHMSEQMTAKRIWAARTARRFPVILEMIERGELHLGAIHLLARHLTAENHLRVLERAKHRSSRDVERLVAEVAPRADVASRVRALPGPRAARATSDEPASSRDRVPVETDRAGSDRAGGDRGHSDPANGDRADGDEADIARDRRSPRTAAPGAATKPIVPLSPRRFRIEITVDEATHDKLRSLQDLLGRSGTGRDPAAIISRAIDVLLVRTLARKAGLTDRPKPVAPANVAGADRPKPGTPSKRADIDSTNPAAAGPGRSGSMAAATESDASPRARRTRTVPAAVRREVWRRDCGRCCYVDARGRRCVETSNVEFHHRTPFALGGQETPDNIELRCAAHNQYQADLDFGSSFMDARRGRNVNAATFPGECREWVAAH